jgi:glycosyltransferase involved in cell wall biosynthesis
MLSIIVPVYNAEKTLNRLLDSIWNQSFKDFELILVDDASTDNSVRIAQSYPCELICLNQNHGPAYCRNIGARHASGEVLLFTDSDCQVSEDWLKNIHGIRFENKTAAIMGKLVLLPSGYLGDSISALGFPAGGAIGFEKIWRVDADGFTNSLSSCNCAVKKEVFEIIGGFDETFPYAGGEDSFLAYTLKREGYRIKYLPDIIVYHEARDSLRGFMKWQLKRGMSSFIFSKKVAHKSDFISLRIWSSKNIISHYWSDKKFPMILFLLTVSLLLQFIGFIAAKHDKDILKP